MTIVNNTDWGYLYSKEKARQAKVILDQEKVQALKNYIREYGVPQHLSLFYIVKIFMAKTDDDYLEIMEHLEKNEV